MEMPGPKRGLHMLLQTAARKPMAITNKHLFEVRNND